MQGTIGASAVLLPGTTVGSQATLAPLTVPDAGTNLNAKTVYLGAPAFPVKVAWLLCLALILHSNWRNFLQALVWLDSAARFQNCFLSSLSDSNL